jgi:2,4-dienoyl-CoA reductase-like NADH-dependent reductase (Old Yellow Enzyme family)
MGVTVNTEAGLGLPLSMSWKAPRANRALISSGRLILANPDLPERLARNAPLNTPDHATFYGGEIHQRLRGQRRALHNLSEQDL